MKLKLKNLGKISYADIDINGITVIAGKNNTGKSTIGKCLFAYYNSFYKIDEAVNKLRQNEICRLFDESLNSYVEEKNDRYYSNTRMLSSELVKRLGHFIEPTFDNKDPAIFDKPEVKGIVDRLCREYGCKDRDKIIEFYTEARKKASVIDEKIIRKTIVNDKFNSVFNGQICNTNSKEATSVEITIKDKVSKLLFDDNDLKDFEQPIKIEHDATLIDDPMIIDKLVEYRHLYINNDLHHQVLIDKIYLAKRRHETSLNSILVKEKMQELLKTINDVVQGELVVQNGTIMLLEKSNKGPISLMNLSLGLKSFVLIKQLIENELIKDNDFLILDEPEVHLHPEWQIKFAEIVVLLQKAYNLNVVLTTHSRDFFEAIELFSKKYGITEKCNYYITHEKRGKIEFCDQKTDPTEIYRQLIEPNDLLDKLRFELEEEENE